MKTTLAYFLLGLCICYDLTESYFAPNPSSLKAALKSVPDVLRDVINLMCKYQHAKEAQNNALYQDVNDELIRLLEKVGCLVDEIVDLQAKRLLGDIGATVTTVVENVIRPILDELKVTEPILHLLCQLLHEPLTSECVENILKKNVPDLIDRLKELACKLQGTGKIYHELYKILKHLGCFADDVLGTEESLENVGEEVATLLDKLTRELAQSILEKNTLVGDVLKGLVCPVLGNILGL